MNIMTARLDSAQAKAQAAVDKTNKEIEILGSHTKGLYQALTDTQNQFDKIRNIPSDKKLQYEQLKERRLEWKQQVEKITRDSQKATAKSIGSGAAGASMGVAVVTMGPTVAMGIATTFGVASTGTAISALSGAAATNAALAWLGGGALVAGGGGMVAGNAFLALAGPVGWTIAGASLITSGLLFWKNSQAQKRLEDIFVSISNRDVKYYELAMIELKERVKRIIAETQKLKEGIIEIKSFGLNYQKMTEAQQYTLGAYFNLMKSATRLLVNPIKGLQPKYNEQDFEHFMAWSNRSSSTKKCRDNKTAIISLANLLYAIYLDKQDRKVLLKSLRKNTGLLAKLELTKDDLDIALLDAVLEAVDYKTND